MTQPEECTLRRIQNRTGAREFTRVSIDCAPLVRPRWARGRVASSIRSGLSEGTDSSHPYLQSKALHEPAGAARRLVARLCKESDMPHFAAWPDCALPVQMELGPWNGQEVFASSRTRDLLNVMADQVHHSGRTQQSDFSQRQSAQCPHLLLELGHGTGVQRVVSGIMRTRGDFVDQKSIPVKLKQFYAKYPDTTERFHGMTCVTTSGETIAGATVIRRIPASCRFSTTGYRRCSPFALRTTSTDSSRT